jgi:glycogen operon protein
LSTRLVASPDLFDRLGRKPSACINFVTAHDGFTLNDIVTYNDKHNEANGEENRDGSSDNRSWNCGVEGPTDDPEINRLRERQLRNFLGTLLLSQGTPMLLAGDEFGRTQKGNNNAYCQDTEIVEFTLPECYGGMQWSLLVDTNITGSFAKEAFAPGKKYGVTARSLLLFVLRV